MALDIDTVSASGGRQLYNPVKRISRGAGSIQDLEKIDELAETMRLTALCGLGHFWILLIVF